MSTCISKSEPSPALTVPVPVDDWRHRAAARLESLLQMFSSKDFMETRVDHLQTLIESLPPDNSNSGLAANYLSKARRYLRSNEVGAAVYELRLLRGWLQYC